MNNNRRQFLSGMGTAAAAAFAAAPALVAQTVLPAATTTPTLGRGFASPSRLYLELAGQPAGRIASEIGGEAIGSVLEEGPDAQEVITEAESLASRIMNWRFNLREERKRTCTLW
jgi:hypothetical protein